MYVCICNGYRDKQLQELARCGVRCVKEAYTTLGAGPRCGRCVAAAQELIDDIHTPRDEGHALALASELAE